MANLITISYGDTETGRETMEAALSVLVEAGAMLEIETIQLGAELVKLGYEHGFSEDELKKIRCSHVLLKAQTAPEVTAVLCEALAIPDDRETYADNHPAQSFSNDEFAIFEPCEASMLSVLNAATMALRFLNQPEVAEKIEKAVDGVDAYLTPELFAAAVITKL